MYKAKQMIIIRRDLKMRKGKIAAQASHGCVDVVLKALKRDDLFSKLDCENNSLFIETEKHSPLIDWFNEGVAKICVYVDSEEELLALYHKAYEKNVMCSLVCDAGYTEFHGEPTYTCLALEPLEIEKADELTGGLPLY